MTQEQKEKWAESLQKYKYGNLGLSDIITAIEAETKTGSADPIGIFLQKTPYPIQPGKQLNVNGFSYGSGTSKAVPQNPDFVLFWVDGRLWRVAQSTAIDPTNIKSNSYFAHAYVSANKVTFDLYLLDTQLIYNPTEVTGLVTPVGEKMAKQVIFDPIVSLFYEVSVA